MRVLRDCWRSGSLRLHVPKRKVSAQNYTYDSYYSEAHDLVTTYNWAHSHYKRATYIRPFGETISNVVSPAISSY